MVHMRSTTKPKGKHRLYICFKEITTRPGFFHQALLLSPATEKDDLKGSFIFHVTNIPDANHPGTQGLLWRHEKREAIPEWIPTLTARTLVAKLPTDKSTSEWAEIIDTIVSGVELVQNDPNWRCGTWVKFALQALEGESGKYESFESIPLISPDLEAEIRSFALTEWKKAHARADGISRILNRGSAKVVRKNTKKLPLLDIRRRGESATLK